MDGEWHVTLPDGRKFPIYHNKSPGGLREWLVAGLEDHPISGFSKEELIQKLVALDESQPVLDKYRAGVSSKGTIKDALARNRKAMARR
jgi:hypothetical protein